MKTKEKQKSLHLLRWVDWIPMRMDLKSRDWIILPMQLVHYEPLEKVIENSSPLAPKDFPFSSPIQYGWNSDDPIHDDAIPVHTRAR